MVNKLLLILAVFSIILGGCATSKSFSKKGMQLDAAGLYQEASKMYLISLEKNMGNVDAQIGLKKTGQMVLDDYLRDYFKAHAIQDYKNAVYTYRSALSYKSNVERFVKLSIPPNYEKDYEDDKKTYLNNLFEEANNYLLEEKYKQAESIFAEMLVLDPKNEDVSNLKNFSKAEPLYRKGISLMETSKYREAYYAFDEVIALQGNFKDAVRYKERCLDEATLTIAFLPFESQVRGGQQVTEKIYADMMQEVLKSKNPFIKVIDRANMDKVIAEQKLAMSGMVDDKYAAQAGRLIGAKMVVTGKLITMKVEEGNLQSVSKKGYTEFLEKSIDPISKEQITKTSYKKVTYDEVSGRSSVALSFQFSMVNTETGEVVLTDLITPNEVDEVAYINYKGDARSLYPGDWKYQNLNLPADKIFRTGAEKQRVNSLAKSPPRNLKSSEELKLKAVSKVSSQAGKNIVSYKPQS